MMKRIVDPKIKSDIRVVWKTKNTLYMYERFFPNSSANLHSHTNRETFYIRKGHGYFHIDSKIIEVQQGHVIAIPPGVVHGIETYGSELDCVVTLHGEDDTEINTMYEQFCKTAPTPPSI
jgi:mannose-6-phosphate isomerase-like protein (cupin superfamily)